MIVAITAELRGGVKSSERFLKAPVSDEEWKEEVKRRMGAARLVVIRAGVGENLLWEAKHAFETLNPQKVLILVLNMKAKDYESFRTKVNPLLGVSLPEGGHQRPVTVRASCGKIEVQFTRWRWTSFPPLRPPVHSVGYHLDLG